MSLDGISPKTATPVLRLAATNPKPVKVDATQRRALDEPRAPHAIRQSEPNAKDYSASQTNRRYPRYVPAANISQILLDAILIGAAQSTVLFLIYDRLGLAGPMQAGVVASFSVVLVLIFLYATGCYRRDAILSTSLSMSRLPIALGFAAAVIFIALRYGFPHLYPAARVYLSISRDVTIILIGTSISLGAAFVSRAIIRAMLNHNLFRRRVLVIGTGKRARYIQELNESHAHGSLQEIHFASESILKDSARTPRASARISPKTRSRFPPSTSSRRVSTSMKSCWHSTTAAASTSTVWSSARLRVFQLPISILSSNGSRAASTWLGWRFPGCCTHPDSRCA